MRYSAADLISDPQVLDAGAPQIGMLIVAIDHGSIRQINPPLPRIKTSREKRNRQP